ncbi:hypothetical protein GCM10023347_37610 [Streptomyces chumphonensis]
MGAPAARILSAYDVLNLLPSSLPDKVQMTMTLLSSAPALSLIASEGEEHGAYASLNPWLIGGIGLFILLLLLWGTTRFNRDR